MKIHKILALTAAGLIVVGELENDFRHEHLFHIERRGYEAPEAMTRQITMDSSSGGGNTGTEAFLRASGLAPLYYTDSEHR